MCWGVFDFETACAISILLAISWQLGVCLFGFSLTNAKNVLIERVLNGRCEFIRELALKWIRPR